MTQLFGAPIAQSHILRHDLVIAVVNINDLAEFKAQHGLRTVGGYWPDSSRQPILFVEHIPPGAQSQETK